MKHGHMIQSQNKGRGQHTDRLQPCKRTQNHNKDKDLATMKEPKQLIPQTLRYLLGMTLASIFSLSYLLSPLYILTAIFATLFRYQYAWIYSTPLILSMITKPIPLHSLVGMLTPMLDYFDYEEGFDTSNEEFRRLIYEEGKNYIFAVQPHGVVSC